MKAVDESSPLVTGSPAMLVMVHAGCHTTSRSYKRVRSGENDPDFESVRGHLPWLPLAAAGDASHASHRVAEHVGIARLLIRCKPPRLSRGAAAFLFRLSALGSRLSALGFRLSPSVSLFGLTLD